MSALLLTAWLSLSLGLSVDDCPELRETCLETCRIDFGMEKTRRNLTACAGRCDLKAARCEERVERQQEELLEARQALEDGASDATVLHVAPAPASLPAGGQASVEPAPPEPAPVPVEQAKAPAPVPPPAVTVQPVARPSVPPPAAPAVKQVEPRPVKQSDARVNAIEQALQRSSAPLVPATASDIDAAFDEPLPADEPVLGPAPAPKAPPSGSGARRKEPQGHDDFDRGGER